MKYFLASLRNIQNVHLPNGFSDFLHFNQNGFNRNWFEITAYKYTSNAGKSIKILFSTNNAKK